jgi:hypothetical protein
MKCEYCNQEGSFIKDCGLYLCHACLEEMNEALNDFIRRHYER